MSKDKLKIEILKSQPFVLYGVGLCGTSIYQMLEKEQIRPVAFCDRKRTGIEPMSCLPIIAPPKLKNEYSEVKILITSLDFAAEILHDLKTMGIDEERIHAMSDFVVIGKPSITVDSSFSATKMKLLFFLNFFPVGGQERVVANLTEAFMNKGYETILVSSLYSYNECEAICSKRIFLNVWPNDLGSLEKTLAEVIMNEQPDVLIGFGAGNAATLANARRLIPGSNTPLIFSQRSDPTSMFLSDPRHEEYYRMVIPEADGAVFQSKEAQSYFPLDLQKKSTIINNLVNKRFFSATFSGETPSGETPSGESPSGESPSSERKNIVGVGRLSSEKNWELAISAFSLIANKINDDFVIYGEGPELENLKNHAEELNISDRMVFAGLTRQPEKDIVNAKLFVLPSNYEGLPNALIEALVLGLPCVCTQFDGGGAERLITDGENGLLVPKGDVDALAGAMLKILSDPKYAQTLAASAKERARKEFDRELVLGRWEGFINKVVEHKQDFGSRKSEVTI